MTVATNVRPGRVFRLLLAQQSAKGTVVDNFTNAAQVWSTEAKNDFVDEQTDPEWWYNYHNSDFVNARYRTTVAQQSTFEAHATPTLISYALQNLFGSLSGSTFTLTGYVNKWLTIGFVEDKTLTNTELRFARVRDVLIHKLTLSIDSTGYAEARCDYAAEAQSQRKLNDLTSLGITLPAAPMDTTDRNVFAGRAAVLTRDPLGTPVTIPFERLVVTFDAGLELDWDQMGRRERVKRQGPLQVSINAHGKAGDEYWQAVLDANTNVSTKQTYRLTMTEPVTGHVLTITMFNVTFNVEPFGIRNQEYDPMELRGMATQDASGNFVTITLT